MAGITSTAGAQAAIQGAMQQLKVQQAKQNAERAEVAARALAARAREARNVAEQAQENARALTVQADQAHNVAGQARQGVSMLTAVGEMQTRLADTVQQASARSGADAKAAGAEHAQPVMNTSGQLTGVVVNTTA